MNEMTKEETIDFLRHGTFTGKLATVRKDESHHVAPIWFVLDDENNNDDMIFTTGYRSLKEEPQA